MKGWSSMWLRVSVGAIAVLAALLLFVFTAIPVSASPLTISSVASGSITDTSATVTWTTDEAADSVVNYGTTTALGSTESDSALVTDHAVGLTNLAPSTLYYYEVSSTNAGGNTTVDNNGGAYYTFTTAATPDTTPAGTSLPNAPVTDAIVSVLIGMLLIWDKVLDGVVDLSAAEPLTGWGSANVRASAEIAIHGVEVIARLVSRVLLSVHLG